jgi:hypothetical protein
MLYRIRLGKSFKQIIHFTPTTSGKGQAIILLYYYCKEGATAVVPKLCAAAHWGAAKYSARPTNYDLFIQ